MTIYQKLTKILMMYKCDQCDGTISNNGDTDDVCNGIVIHPTTLVHYLLQITNNTEVQDEYESL